MSKYFKFLLIFLIAISPWVLLSKILFLAEPPVWPDEAIFADTAVNILNTGMMKTSLFGEAIPGLSKHALWYPPLYFYVLAGWIKIFGQSIEAIRILSFLLALATLIVFFYTLQKIFSKLWLSFAGVLLLSNDLYFSGSSRVARMDMLNFFFIIASIFLFIQAKAKREKRLYVLAGIFCGMAILTHPYGLIAPGVLFIYLLIQKSSLKTKIVYGVYMTVPVIIALFVWFLLIGSDFSLFITQYKLQFLRKAHEEVVPVAMITNHDFLWLSLYIGYFIFFVSLIVKIIKHYEQFDLFLMLGALVSVSVAIWGKEFWFLLYFQPFLILIVLSVLHTLQGLKKTPLTVFYSVLIFVIWTLNIYYYAGYILEVRGHIPNYHQFTKFIRQNLPPNAKILLVSIPDPYFDLRKTGNFSFYEFPTVPVSYSAYKKVLDDSDFIIYFPGEGLDQDQIVKKYFILNAKKYTTVTYPVGYSGLVIELMDKGKRR